METTVQLLVDYEGALARRVAGDLWAALSKAALEAGAGHTKTIARWDSLRAPGDAESSEATMRIHVMQQDHPEAVELLRAAPDGGVLYGIVVAVPDRPNPLAGSLLYQGVERLKENGVKAKDIEPVLLSTGTEECGRYALKLIERLQIHR